MYSAPTYRAGELDQRVKIVREASTPDGIGGNTIALSEVAEVWAHVRHKTGREQIKDDRLDAKANYVFVIRWRDDILPDDRLQWLDSYYNIRAIKQNGGRRLYLEIDAEYGVAQ